MRLLLRVALALLLAALPVGATLYFVFPQFVSGLARDFERSRSGLASRAVTLPDGLRMAYFEGGRGDTLVLLHGSGADKDHFAPIAPFLTRHYRIVVPDLVGSGDSSHPAGADLSPSAQADRLVAFCRALGIERPHVGGSAMGGRIALVWAAHQPAQVQSLWVLDADDAWRDPAAEAARLEPRIAGLKTATLIVLGTRGRVVDAATAPLLRAVLPRSHVVLMPQADRLPALEQPEKTASDYIRFRDSM